MADAPKILGTDTLRQAYPKLNNAIDNSNEAVNTANSAKSRAETADSKADSALSKSNNTQTQLDTIVITGDSSVEAAQARVNPGGYSYSTLKNRLDETDNLRAKVDDRAFYEGVKMNRRHKAIMSIVDDDGYPQVHSLLKPLTEQEGVPITIAAITSRVGTSELSMTLQQLKECQESGMEVQSHTHTHQALATLTYAEQENEIRSAKEWLQNNGFSSDVIIYPFGSTNADTYEITNRYHSAGIYIDSGSSLLNNPPIRREKLERVYYNLTTPVTEGDKNRIQQCKNKIDEAITSNSWIIIGLHCFYEGFNPEGLREVIQYAKSKGVEIVSLKRGLELYSNIIDLPDFQVGADGKLKSNQLGHMQKMVSAADNSTPLTSFPQDAYSYRLFNDSAASSGSMPEPRAGVLETFRGASDDYGYQFYRMNILNRAYKRRWDNVNKTWTAWALETPNFATKEQMFTVGTVAANSTADFTMSGSAISLDSIPSVTVKNSIPAGIMVSGYVNGSGSVVVRVANVTGAPINCGSMIFRAMLLLQLS